MKCRECSNYTKCVKESNLAIKRKNCPNAKIKKVKTNADRIRAMSDEELAKLIVDNHPMHAWNKEVRHIYFDGPRITHKEAWLQWLQQPAEE